MVVTCGFAGLLFDLFAGTLVLLVCLISCVVVWFLIMRDDGLCCVMNLVGLVVLLVSLCLCVSVGVCVWCSFGCVGDYICGLGALLR